LFDNDNGSARLA